MRYRKLDENKDYSWGGSEKSFYQDVPAAAGQAAETRLLLFTGEWYLNTDEGTPYFQGILGKHSQSTADSIIQDRILGSQGVTSIQDYKSSIDGDLRSMVVTATINTIYGVTEVQIQNFRNF